MEQNKNRFLLPCETGRTAQAVRLLPKSANKLERISLKRNNKSKSKKSDKTLEIACLAVIVIGAISLFLLSLPPRQSRHDGEIESNKGRTPEEYVIGKLRETDMKSRFAPVQIYRIDGSGAFFAGSGSYFVGSNGEQVITSEHLFPKEFGNALFAFRKLRPFEQEITHGISKILHRSPELALNPGETPDVVILQAGTTNSIECYSDRVLDIGSESSEHSEMRKIEEKITVRSLVSGEPVRIVGLVRSKFDRGMQYVLLEYESTPGESGTGFVTTNDDLYVLKARFFVSEKDREPVSRLLGTSRKLALGYGPFVFHE